MIAESAQHGTAEGLATQLEIGGRGLPPEETFPSRQSPELLPDAHRLAGLLGVNPERGAGGRVEATPARQLGGAPLGLEVGSIIRGLELRPLGPARAACKDAPGLQDGRHKAGFLDAVGLRRGEQQGGLPRMKRKRARRRPSSVTTPLSTAPSEARSSSARCSGISSGASSQRKSRTAVTPPAKQIEHGLGEIDPPHLGRPNSSRRAVVPRAPKADAASRVRSVRPARRVVPPPLARSSGW